jgi:hypothetical protein
VGRVSGPFVEPDAERVDRPFDLVGALEHRIERLHCRQLATAERCPELAGRQLADIHGDP